MTLNCIFIDKDRALIIYPKMVQATGWWTISPPSVGKLDYEVTRVNEPSYRLLAHSTQPNCFHGSANWLTTGHSRHLIQLSNIHGTLFLHNTRNNFHFSANLEHPFDFHASYFLLVMMNICLPSPSQRVISCLLVGKFLIQLWGQSFPLVTCCFISPSFKLTCCFISPSCSLKPASQPFMCKGYASSWILERKIYESYSLSIQL